MTDAAASNPAGTVHVRATENGLLVGLQIDRSELSFGGEALAASILTVCAEASAVAAQRHRAALLRDGISREVVDRVAPTVRTLAVPRAGWTVRP